MIRQLQFAAAALFVAALAAPVYGAGLSGTLQDGDGNPVEGLQARMWRDDDGKGFEIVAETLSDASGNFSFTDLPAGDYRLDARMPPLFEGNYADRWYDVMEPNSEGWIGASADTISLGEADAPSGYVIQLPVYGGADARVMVDGAPASGFQVRMERALDPRIHHNDTSDPDPVPGEFSMRGLPPAEDYRILIHDPNANRDDLIAGGPFTVASGSNTAIGDLPMPGAPTDPYEPNNDAAAEGANSVDASLFGLAVPEPWISDPTWLGPRNGDLDWYCFFGEAGQRYKATVLPGFTVGGEERENPWFDPTLSFWAADGPTLMGGNDDGVDGTLRPTLESIPVPVSGRYCFVVSAYGDSDWTGTNQQSAGRYAIAIELGNFPPDLEVEHEGAPAPLPPETIRVDEAETLLLDLSYSDAEGEPVTVSYTHVDAFDNPIEGTLDAGPSSGTYSWLVGSVAAELSPYLITFDATDGVTHTFREVLVEVNRVNEPPPTPELISPTLGSSVASTFPELRVTDVDDPEGDPVSYEFEIRRGSTSSAPTEVQTIPEDPGGDTHLIAASLPENTLVYWRVRATDGQEENAFSPWSDFWDFTISLENDPPLTPVLVKPFDGEEILDRIATLSVENTEDPERNAIGFIFEIARNAEFTNLIEMSSEIPQSAIEETTTWTSSIPLSRGEQYFARAVAIDEFGARSEYSNVNGFTVVANTPPSEPSLGQDFATQCGGLVLEAGTPPGFAVDRVVDGEDTLIMIELELLEADGEEPIFTASVQQPDEGNTVILFDESLEENGHYVVRVRAFDGDDYSEWTECDFWVNGVDDPLPAVEILVPEEGAQVPAPMVVAQVVNLLDPEAGMPGKEFHFAYCMTTDGSACAEDLSTWTTFEQVDSELNVTNFELTGLVAGQTITLEVCAVDESETCRSSDTVTFTVVAGHLSTSGGCGCEVTPSPTARGAWALLALLGLVWRRRVRAS